jgi:cytochrome c oxidase subunit 2
MSLILFYVLLNSLFLGVSSILWASLDAPERFQVGIQDPATTSIEWLIALHDKVMISLVVIVTVIIFLLYEIIIAKHSTILNFTLTKKIPLSNKAFSHAQNLEIFWTVIPAFVLLGIATPTFNLIYALDDLVDPALVLKITGHQWYWSYEFSTSLDKTTNFDSYIVTTSDLNFGSLRLLETNERIILPQSTHIRLLITSADVLHSWTIPSFGVKVDACPGRLSQASIFIKRAGLFFGQCSEICGINHGFMPIVVKSISAQKFYAQN